MHESEQGPVEEITRIPTWTNRPEPNNDPNKEDEDVQLTNNELPPGVETDKPKGEQNHTYEHHCENYGLDPTLLPSTIC